MIFLQKSCRLLLGLSSIVALVGMLLFLSSRSAPLKSDPQIVKIDTLTVDWNQFPERLQVLSPYKLEMIVTDQQLDYIELEQVAIRLYMDDMLCGEYQKNLERNDQGFYEAEIYPLMAGNWKAQLKISEKSGKVIYVERHFIAVY